MRPARYAPPITRDLASRPLNDLDPEEEGRAAEDGDLDGNKAYEDLRGMSWEDAAATLQQDRMIVARLSTAEDLDESYEGFETERLSEWGADALWGLDPGVAAATIALSALGATPVSSCNGGVLGGDHLEKYPLVTFYEAAAPPQDLLACVEAANAGLLVDGRGRIQLFGATCEELLAFAGAAVRLRGEGA